MRYRLSIVILFLPSLAFAQEAEQKRATIQFLTALQTPPEGGGFAGDPREAKATLHATIAAVRSLKYLTGKKAAEAVPNARQTAAFVMSCYDPKTGGFADEPGGKADVALTSIGVMVGVDLDIPKEQFARAMNYLKAEVFAGRARGEPVSVFWLKDRKYLAKGKDIYADYVRNTA